MVACYDFSAFCGGVSRYQWFNVAALTQHGTFEIRNHEGTLDGVRICNWIKAHARFFDAVAGMKFHEIKRAFTGTAAQVWRAVTNTWDDPALRRYWRRTRVYNAASV
jgi:hypothetical protein